MTALPQILPATRAASLPRAGALAALAAFVAMQAAAVLIAGVFEYPLDDVYIHLAMASGMAGGTYGVNPGEAASAASSILYPALLMPFPDSELQRMLPLLWNAAGVTACGGLWGKVLAEGGITGRLAMPLAVLGPVALNMAGVAFLGMEHSLHTALTLALVLGLWRFLNDGRVASWFVAATVLSPMFRLEGLALSLAAAGLVALGERRRAGVWLGVAVVVPVAGFMAGLMALGLPPLPSSVLVKLARATEETGFVEGIVLRIKANAAIPGGALLAGLTVAALIAALAMRSDRQTPARRLSAAVAAAGAAHLVLGQIGWLHRYEHYVVVALLAGLVLAASQAGPAVAAALRGLTVLATAAAAAVWLPEMLGNYLWNPRAVHLQQAQMARLAQDFIREPVAVNDLGRVVWGNPDHVLDLWGLASDRARRLRLDRNEAPDGWADTLVQEHGVRLAMVYDRWIDNGIGPGWVKIGVLDMIAPRGLLGDWQVDIYATRPEAAAELTERLRAFAPTLPEDAVLRIVAGTGG